MRSTTPTVTPSATRRNLQNARVAIIMSRTSFDRQRDVTQMSMDGSAHTNLRASLIGNFSEVGT